MKKLIVLVFVMLVSVASFATEKTKTSNKEVKKELRKEIIKLLINPEYDLPAIEATIEFSINSKGQVVVLNVSSNSNKNYNVTEYIKSKLNHEKITSKKIEGVYRLPLKIVK